MGNAGLEQLVFAGVENVLCGKEKKWISYEIFMKSKRNRLHCRDEKGIIVTVRTCWNGYAGSHLRERKEQI